MNMRQEAEDLLHQKLRSVSFMRSDAERDAYVEIRRVKPRDGIHLQDRTGKFWRQIRKPVPVEGRVIFSNLPCFGSPGDGKALANGTPVLTPGGWVPIENLRVGDKVIGDDGRPYAVRGVFPQGVKETFRVSFEDGAWVDCCDEHLWYTTTKDDELARGIPGKVRTLQEIRTTLESSANGPKASKSGVRKQHWVPMVKPVQFAGQAEPLPLHPYVLGALIGDGCLTRRAIELANVEEDVRDRVAALLPTEDIGKHRSYRADGRLNILQIARRVPLLGRYGKPSRTLELLEELGLHGKDCFTKFIPRAYLMASQEVRMELLRGLIDTDGSVAGNHGNTLGYSTASAQLRDDVMFLVRSLGGRVKFRQESNKYHYRKGFRAGDSLKRDAPGVEVRQGKPAYVLSIRMPTAEPPVASQKNLARWKWGAAGQQRTLRKITAITPVGLQDCTCISVDAPNQLFVTKDFIVTHNTVMGLSIVLELIQYYGWDNVSVYISDHLPSLADALRDRATPVQILFVDDALKNYSSRAGGNDELIEAIGLFTTLRHEFEEAQDALNGIVFVVFTSQMYKGLDKVFREGYPIFKTALVSDKEEIVKATQMSSDCWDYLFEIARDVAEGDTSRMSDGVVVLKGYEPGRIHIPMVSTERANAVLQRFLQDEVDEARRARLESALESPHMAVKYKAIEKQWTIQRRVMTKEQYLVYMNGLMAKLAREFAQEREEDTGSNEGKAAVREWIERRTYHLDTPPEKRLSGEDYLYLKAPRNAAAFCQKVVTARSEMGKNLVGGVGQGMRTNELLDFVAMKFLDEGFDPDDKDDKDRFQSMLWRLPDAIKNDAVKMRTAIASRIKELKMRDYPYGFHPVAVQPRPPEPKVHEVVAEAGAYFDPKAEELLDKMVEAAYAKKKMLWRQLKVYRACVYPKAYEGKVLGDPTAIATTAEGHAWQHVELERRDDEEPLSRPQISKDRTAGASYFHNEVGLMFEKWIEQQLRTNYVVRGVFDKGIIAKVERFGGNESQPDLIVTYNDGSKDYVSLKCYNSAENFNITTNSERGEDEINPERVALRDDERRGVVGNRVVVVVRNLYYGELQEVRVFTRTSDIPETIGVKRPSHDRPVVKFPWVARDQVRGASAPEAAVA